MVSLETHCLLSATTLGVGGVIWKGELPFLMTGIPNFFSGANVSASYRVDPGGSASPV